MATKRTEGGRALSASSASSASSATLDRGDEARANLGIQRPAAEVLHARELEVLREHDAGPKPPGWKLSPKAVRAFILGDEALGVRRKFVGNPALVDRAMVALATNRGLLLVGEPGTAKSLLSELLAAAISGRSTLTIQGSAGTTDDQIKYSWNYALLLAEGPSLRALVPSPLYLGMQAGAVVRFEEITRCPLETQDSLLAALSDRVLAVPELEGEAGMLFAKDGFNVVATANTRDLGVNEMSAALKRRFNFETVFPIADMKVEIALVREETRRLLDRAGVPTSLGEDVLDLLVTTFRELRAGETADGQAMEKLSSPMSTAECVSVGFAVGVRGYYLGGGKATPADVVECLAGAAIKSSSDDTKRLRRYFEQRVARREGAHWRAYYEARHRLPG
jgi:MoxR-like ATPase